MAAATYFRDQVARIETSCHPSKETVAPPEYRHYWCSSVIFAVLAMEANAYDLMTAISRGESTPGRALRLEDLGKPLLDRYALLYQVATRGKVFRHGKGIAHAAGALLIALRDEIQYSKTELRSAKVSRKLEASLRARFTLCPFRCEDVFFYDQCASASSAEWAVETSHNFIAQFARATGYRLNV